MTVIAILLVVVVVGWVVTAYNRLVGLGRRADSAWADIDAQLKRRHDLVPPLVEVVGGYAAHERTTLEEVVRLRTEARALDGDAGSEAAVRESLLAGSLRQLFALSEAYPDLLASDRFAHLQHQLAEIEERLQNARRYYNAVVRDLNTAVQRFPDLLIARTFGFAQRNYFELDSALEREVVKVDLDA